MIGVPRAADRMKGEPMSGVDDGKYDPADVKIENHDRAWNDQLAWEREFKQMDKAKPRRRLRDRLWGVIETLGRSLDPTQNTGGFYE